MTILLFALLFAWPLAAPIFLLVWAFDWWVARPPKRAELATRLYRYLHRNHK